jgi:hypothetical protein
MSAAVPAVLAFAITFGAMFIVLGNVLGAQTTGAQGFMSQHELAFRAAHSDIRLVTVTATDAGTSTDVYVTVTNAGKLSYATLQDWEVIASYIGAAPNNLTAKRVPHSASVATNKWNPETFYLDSSASQAEVIEKGVLNPLEELRLRIRLNPESKQNQTGMVVISPPWGGPVTAFFTGP